MQFLSLRHRGSTIVPYAPAWVFQKALLEKRIRDEIPDTFLFVEHSPTITRGRGLQWTPERGEARAAPLGPISEGTEYFEIERGGDLTWHGPGQLVIYPIVKLDGSGFGPYHDVTGFLRKLERVVCEWLGNFGIVAESRENAAGIWVRDSAGEDRKIASVGIAVRKWVTYHGLALNLSNDRAGFSAIVPCGYAPEVMTNLEEILRGASPAREEAETRIARRLAEGEAGAVERFELTGSNTHPSTSIKVPPRISG
jgi:lipoate-protein ligase B